jgi:hypothetical protein
MVTACRKAAFLTSVVALLAAAGCDNDPRGIGVGGGVMEPSPVLAASIVTTPIPFETLPAFSCPLFSPFRSSVALFIDQRGGLDITLNQASFRFVDASGFGSTVFFAPHDLNAMFGIPFIASGTSRVFTFQPAFGCGMVARPRSLAAQIVALDRSGRRLTQMLNAVLR